MLDLSFSQVCLIPTIYLLILISNYPTGPRLSRIKYWVLNLTTAPYFNAFYFLTVLAVITVLISNYPTRPSLSRTKYWVLNRTTAPYFNALVDL